MTAKPRVGLLGLMLELYDRAAPELRPYEEEFAARLAERLSERVEVTFSGIANTREGVEERMREFAAAGVDLIAVVHLSYAPSLIALPALSRTPLPVVLLNTQELPAITEDFCELDMLRNHGMHGQQDLANVLLRAGKDFGVITGHWQDENLLDELEDWALAAAAVTHLRQTVIGRVGWNFDGMGDFGLDETSFLCELGPQVKQVPLSLLADAQAAASPEQVQAIVDDYRARYEIAPECTDEVLEASARSECGLREAVSQLGLGGFSLHYEVLGQDPRFNALPMAAAARLLGEGLGFGGEGDVTSAAMVLALHQLVGVASFSEMFTMDLGGGTIFMSHFAEGNPLLADPAQPIRLVRREGWVGSGGPSASLAFTFASGALTLVNLTVGPGNRLHLIATLGESLSFLVPGQPTPHFRFRPAQPLNEFLTTYLRLGGSHHVAVAPGFHLRRVQCFAQLAGLDLDVI